MPDLLMTRVLDSNRSRPARRRAFEVIRTATLCAALGGCAGDATPVPTGVVAGLPAMPQPDARPAWRPIDLRDGGRIGSGYAASRQVRSQEGSRYAWLAITLSHAIRLPEVEQEARSVVFLGEYQCGEHAWRPLQALWYRDPDGRNELLRETPRGLGGLQTVAKDTLADAFLDAICSG